MFAEVERSDCAANETDIRLGHIGSDRKTEEFSAEAFRDRELPCFPAPPREGGLEMNRNRVAHDRVDAPFNQVLQ